MFLLLLIALTACGTLDISLDQTPELAYAGFSPESSDVLDAGTVIPEKPSETPQLAGGWGPLISNIHPAFGYELLVHEGATVGQEAAPTPALIDDLVVVFARDNNACTEAKVCAKRR